MFKAEVHYQKWLSPDTRRIDVIITIDSQFDQQPAAAGVASTIQSVTTGGQALFEVLMIDISGSMSGNKLVQAKAGACKAIELLESHQQFAVIAGDDRAHVVVSPCYATPRNKQEAYRMIDAIELGGNTHMYQWLEAARDLFIKAPQMVRHATLLTDGHDNGGNLPFTLEKCKELFRCDCRGIGADWKVEEVRDIANALGGTIGLIGEARDIAGAFTDIVREAASRTVSNMGLRISVPLGGKVLFCKQMYPTVLDLSDKRRTIDGQTIEFSTGAWGKELREYLVAIEIKTPGQVLQDMRFGKVSLHCPSLTGNDQPLVCFKDKDGKDQPACGITGTWTADDSKSALVNKRVAHYTGQEEAAECTQRGIKDWEDGNFTGATQKLGRAVQLYAEAGNTEGTARLERMVDIIDARSGTVRLRSGADKLDAMDINCKSTRTDRLKKE